MWRFHGEKLLAFRPTPQMEIYPLSAVRDCVFNIFAAALRILQPQSEDAPRRGARDPPIMEITVQLRN